jgi:hypothetical protein
MWCISSALIQFSSYILKKQTWLHKWCGKVYVFVVLILGAPTGMYMSFFAKGTTAERMLFLFMAVTWFATTLKGLQAIHMGNVQQHKNWMLRSYAMTLTAVTFRIYHIIFFIAGWQHFTNYAVSLWLSVVGNILFTEIIIAKKNSNYLNTLKLSL